MLSLDWTFLLPTTLYVIIKTENFNFCPLFSIYAYKRQMEDKISEEILSLVIFTSSILGKQA